MGVFAWFAGLAARTRRAQYQVSRWNKESLAPTLRVKRLEDRRVLNADAMPVDQLVVDAGGDSGDGQADTFHIEQDAERVRVSVNGQEVANAALSDISGISIRGSLDDDILMAEFKGGEPLAGLELLFDGGEGGNDSLTLGGEAAVDEISYSFGEGGENRIQINSAEGSAQISYRGVEAVDDQLIAADRSFRMEDDGQDVTLDDAGAANDDISRLVVSDAASYEDDLVVSFRNPSESLVIDNSARQDETDSLSLAGLDSGFDADLRVVGSSEDAISIGGSIGVGQGDVDLVSGSILLSGRVSTNAASVSFAASRDIYIGTDGGVFNAGGTITVEAPRIEQDGVLLAAGGQVKLDSGDGGITIVRGLVDVSQNDASQPAGTVYVLGSYVGLFDNAQVYAAAALGGGTVLIGGDYQGKNPSVRNAVQTQVGRDVLISANADVAGDGGKVVVWADDLTYFLGHISARGAGQGGDGGFVEASGRDTLIYRGTADLRSEAGQTGTLLLDPTTLTIAGGTGDGAADGNATFEGNASATDGFIAFTDATPVTVFESEIEGQSATANIILEATQTITTSGNFTDDAVTLAPGSNLTLRTRNQAGDGAGTINLTASLDGANLLFRTQGAGTITIEGSTDGGAASNISLGRLQSDTGTISVSTNNGTISLLGDVVSGGSMAVTNAGLFTTAAAGDITLSGAGAFLQNGAGLNSLAGDITTADQNITFTTGVTLTGNVLLSTGAGGAGDITLATVTGTTAGAEDLTLLAGTGNITAGAIGATRLDDLQVTSANNATFSSVTADTFTQLAGTGTTTFNGTQNYTGNFQFTGNALTINQPLSAAAMTVTNAGLFTTAAAGDITLTGAFLQNGAGLNSLAGDITTADQNITFTTGIALTGNVLLTTGAGGAGDITLATVTGTIAGAQNLTLLAGTGNVLLLGAVGAPTALGQVTASGAAISTASVTTTGDQSYTATGSVTIGGALNSTTGDITIVGGAVNQNANITTGGAGVVTATATITDIMMAAGAITTTDTGAINYLADDNVALSLLTSTAGAISVTATNLAITDANGSAENIDGPSASLVANTAIGTITAFGVAEVGADSNGAGDAIEIDVVTLTLAQTMAAGSTIHLIQDGNLTLAANSVIVAGANAGQAIVHATGDLNATLATAISLTAGDDLALISGGTLSIPAAGFNVGAGDLRMIGETDVVAAGGNLTFTANRLYFRSGGAGGSATLDTNVARIIAHLETNDLTVNEANSIQLNSVTTGAGNITVNTAAAGNIAVGLVDADTSNVTLTSAGNITSVSPDGTADVRGSIINLTAAVGGIGNVGASVDVTIVPNAMVDEALNASTADNSDIFIDSIGDLPVGLVTAGAGDVTLNSTGNIREAAPDATTDVLGSLISLDADAGGIGTGAEHLDVTTAASLNADTTADNSGIFIDSIGNLPVGLVTAGIGHVTLDSTGNITSVAPNGAADVVGSTIDLTAAVGGIGTAAAHLDVSVTLNPIEIEELDASTAADNSDIFLDSIGNLPVGLVNAGSGDVTVESTGNIVDFALDSVTNIAATDLTLMAATDIGASINSLDSAVTRFEGTSIAGGLFLVDQNALDIGGISATVGATAAGALDIRTATQDLNVNESVSSSDQSVHVQGQANLQINATVTGNTDVTGIAVDNNLNAAQTVTAVTGSATLTAGNDANVNAAVTGNQNVIGTAGNDWTNTQAVTATLGSVTLSADNDANLNGAVTGGQNVTGTAGQNLTTTQTVTATAGTATLNATSGDATLNGTVTAGTNVSSTAGSDVNFNAAITAGQNVTGTAGDNLTAMQTVTATAGSATLNATAGDATTNAAVTAGANISSTAGSDINFNSTVTAGQNVTGMAGDNLTTMQAVTATAGSATLNSGDNTTLNATVTAGTDVSSSAGLDANYNAAIMAGANISGAAGNNLTAMQLTATAGSATLGAGNNANLNGTVLAGQNVTGTAGQNLTTMQTVTATAGSATLNATNGDATLNAAVAAGTNISSAAGSDVNFNGTVTAGQNVSATAGDNLTSMQAVTATAGTATLNATLGDATLNAAVTAGTNVSSTAGSDVNFNGTITAGQNVTGIAGDNLTTMQAVTATAGSATLDAGNDATLNATVTAGQNVVGTADNNLTTMQAVTATAGSTTLSAGNDANLNGTVLAGQNVTGTAGQNLTTMQSVTATAGSVMLDAGSNATIGAPVNALGGGGQIVAGAGGNLVVNGQLSANDDITGMAGVNINTSQVIDSTTGTVTLDAGNVVSIGADVNAKGPAGEIVLTTAQNDRAALQLGAGVELDTTNGSDGGRISAATFQLLGTRFTLLDTSVDLTFPPLTLGANLATVRIIATDAAGIRFRVEVDWMESNAGPDGERFDVIVIDGNSITDVTHRYVDNPTGDAAADIPILVRIIALGPDNSIRAFIGDGAGGTVSVLDHFDATSDQTGISTEILIDVQDIPSAVITFPAPGELPSTPDAPPSILASFEFASRPVERGNTTFIESSTGGVVRGENRYYELRIVSFDEDGNLVETPTEESINLNDPRLEAIAPFDPSKLPALFGRLPADRYRIYLIEDGTERLILDFIIQQGQPIEVPETFEGDVEGPAGPIEGNGAVRELLDTDQLVQPGAGDFGWALPGPAAHLQAAESFAERFGNASFVSHGGMMVGAAAVAAASSGRWEKSMDRVMEQFGRRRPFTRRRKVTRQSMARADHAPRTSLSLKD